MSKLNKNISSGLKWTLFVLFSLYMAGITFFTHSHVIDHVRIVHSHPYKKTSQNHHHTVADIVLFDQITHFASTTHVVPHFSLEEKSIFLGFIQPQPCKIFLTNELRTSVSLRAPPALVA